MDSGKGAVFAVARVALMMFAVGEGQAESSVAYGAQDATAQASASVRIAVNIPVKTSMTLSPVNTVVWSNTDETESGIFISCDGVGVETDRVECQSGQEVNAVYSLTAL